MWACKDLPKVRGGKSRFYYFACGRYVEITGRGPSCCLRFCQCCLLENQRWMGNILLAYFINTLISRIIILILIEGTQNTLTAYWYSGGALKQLLSFSSSVFLFELGRRLFTLELFFLSFAPAAWKFPLSNGFYKHSIPILLQSVTIIHSWHLGLLDFLC